MDFCKPYFIFNLLEACVWWAVALLLPRFVSLHETRQRSAVQLARVGFLIFGVTDVVEAPACGRLPWWLWAMKIATGAYLLGCRVAYVGLDRIRLTDRFLVLGMVLFIASTVAIGISIFQELW